MYQVHVELKLGAVSAVTFSVYASSEAAAIMLVHHKMYMMGHTVRNAYTLEVQLTPEDIR